MKALSIVAIVLAGISFIIPVVGVFTAIGATLLALISFRSQATLSGIAIGLNIINTAFFSPSLLIAEAGNQIIGASSREGPQPDPSSNRFRRGGQEAARVDT